MELARAALVHGDILVMDGQCQDEFLHCTDPGLEQERIYVTLRWIKHHSVSSLLQTCAQGSSAAVTVGVGDGAFFGHSGCSLESCAHGEEGEGGAGFAGFPLT